MSLEWPKPKSFWNSLQHILYGSLLFFSPAGDGQELGALNSKSSYSHEALIEQLTDHFWGSLKVKLIQLPTNYEYEVAGSNTLTYYGEDGEGCHSLKNTRGRQAVAEISYSQKSEPNWASLDVRYSSCGFGEILHESVVRYGRNLKPLIPPAIFTGINRFQLEKGETKRVLTYHMGDNCRLLKVTLLKKGSQRQAAFELNQGQVAFLETFGLRQSQLIRSQLQNMHCSLTELGGSIEFNFLGSQQVILEIRETPSGAAKFISNQEMGFISQTEFQEAFNQSARKSLEPVRQAIRIVTRYQFPESEFFSSGSRNDRLIEELTLNYNRLITGVETELVKVFFLQLIEAARENQLIDNRPEN